MNGLKIPLDFSNGNIYQNNICKANDVNEKQKLRNSIEGFVKLLLQSPNNSFKPDYTFGFSLNNFKFENVENKTGAGETINSKKVKDYNIGLKKVISKFENRLKDVHVTAELNSEKTEVKISIKAKYLDNRDFIETVTFYIWKKR